MENLGKRGKDKVTGFEGIIIGKAVHLYGCATFSSPALTWRTRGETV